MCERERERVCVCVCARACVRAVRSKNLLKTLRVSQHVRQQHSKGLSQLELHSLYLLSLTSACCNAIGSWGQHVALLCTWPLGYSKMDLRQAISRCGAEKLLPRIKLESCSKGMCKGSRNSLQKIVPFLCITMIAVPVNSGG